MWHTLDDLPKWYNAVFKNMLWWLDIVSNRFTKKQQQLECVFTV